MVQYSDGQSINVTVVTIVGDVQDYVTVVLSWVIGLVQW